MAHAHVWDIVARYLYIVGQIQLFCLKNQINSWSRSAWLYKVVSWKCSCLFTPRGYTLTTWFDGSVDSSEMMDSARERAMILFLSWLLSSKSHLIRIRVRALAQRISVRTIVHKTPAKSGFWVLSRNQSSKTTISKYHSRGRRIDVSSSTSSISSCCVVNFATSLMCNGASVTAIGPRLIVVSSVSKVERRFRHLMPRSDGVGFWNKNNLQVFTIKLRFAIHLLI